MAPARRTGPAIWTGCLEMKGGGGLPLIDAENPSFVQLGRNRKGR
jgi:hypothetical protein